MNKVCLAGRLTRDPNIRYSQNESHTCVARFTLAVNRKFRNKDDSSQQDADFISCVAFGKTAEFIEKYAKKGMKFDVTGRIQTGSYPDKNGQTVYTTDVVIEDIEFGESKKATEGNGQQTNPVYTQQAPQAQQYQGQVYQNQQPAPQGFMNAPSYPDPFSRDPFNDPDSLQFM